MIRHLRTRGIALLIVTASVFAVSCKEQRPPRTRADIFQARLKVDTLYLTEDGEEIIAPGNSDRVIVTETGKLAWPAWECQNSSCPGRSNDGSPFLFPWPDPFKSAEGGQIKVRQPLTAQDDKLMANFSEQKCPKCLEVRDLDKETEEQRQQYKNWVQPHVTASAAEQLQALDEELQERMAREAARERGE